MCQFFVGELISQSNQESVDQFVVKFGVQRGSQPSLWGEENCANPRQSYNMCTTTNSPTLLQPHILISNFPSSCARLCIKTSRLVKNVRLPKVQNIQPCRARLLARSLSLFFGDKFIFAVDPVHCWSPPALIHSE